MNLQLSIKKLKLTRGKAVAAVVLLAVLGCGAFFYWQFHAEPPSAWVLKWRIHRYLEKQTGRSDFRIDFKFPSQAEMKTAPPKAKGKPGDAVEPTHLAKKDFETVKKEYTDLQVAALRLEREVTALQKELARKRAQMAGGATTAPGDAGTNAPAEPPTASRLQTEVTALEKNLAAKQLAAEEKQKALEPARQELQAFRKNWSTQRQVVEAVSTNPLSLAQVALTKEMRQKFEEATSYEAMYRLIAQQLWVAERLLGSANPEHGRVGVRIARQASLDALGQTMNGWLASSIVQAYLLSNLDLAESRAMADAWIGEAADVFRRSDNVGSVLTMYKGLLAQASTPQRADWARVQIAQAHEQAGEYPEAIRWLKQVKATNDFRWAMQRIPWLERRVQRQR